MGWPRTLPVLLALVSAGCTGPTCESACEKAFSTCALTSLDPTSSINAQIEACTRSCSGDMRSDATQPRAVGWTACVDEYQCDPDDDGLDLCLTCQAGYYLGQSTGSACQYAEASSVAH